MAKTIDLVFGVKGASVGGASGRIIISQLKTLATKISDDTSKIPKVKFGVNEKSTRAEIQKQLTRISKDIKVAPLSVNVNLKTGSSPNGKLSDKSLSQLYGAQEKSLKRIYSLRTKLANKKISSGESAELKKQLSLEKESYNTINKQIATFGTLHNKAQRRQQLTSQTLALESKLSQEKARQVRLSEEQSKSSLEQLQTQLQDVNNKIVANAYGSESDRLGLKNADPADVDAYILKISKLKSEIEQALKNPVTSKNAAYIDDLINQYENLINVERKALIQSGKVTQSNNSVQLSYIKLANNISDYITKHEASLKVKAPQEYQTLLTLQQQLRDNIYQGTPNSAKKIFEEMQISAREAGGEVETLGQKIKRVFGEKLGYGIIASAAMMARRSIREMYNNVVQIDTAMTELKKVTNETDESYKRFLDGSAERAQKLGATISDVVTATADFARLGYNLEDASILSDTAIIYKNVGDGISDINSASESIISTMKAFGYEASDVMSIVDKFNEVGNNYAISSKGVGDALMRSASAMAAANNTLDETIALSTAANTVVQDPEKVGTALKTISMYLRAAKTEAEDAGESTDGMAESVSELQSKLLSLTGGKVNILQADGQTYKSTYQILKELSDVYDSLSDVSQANILELIGGKRNSNITAALLEGFDVAEKSLATSMDSAGSALEENDDK